MWRSRGMREGAQPGPHKALAEHENQPAGGRQKRTESDRGRAMLAARGEEREPGNRPDGGGDERDRQQHLPAKPGTKRREQLEIPVPHAFLTGYEPEQMIDAPQADV